MGINFQLYRHGERTPVSTYPNDPYQEDAWPNGFKQLTKVTLLLFRFNFDFACQMGINDFFTITKGCQQQYELGRYLRQRYNGFLDESYNASQIYVRSTDYDRTLASAACHLSGLYPPTGEQVWNSEIQWQPIPVHTVSTHDDYLLKVGHECPAFDPMFKEANDDFVNNLYKEYEAFLEYVKNATGVKQMNAASLKRIATALRLEKNAGFALPEWTRKVWIDPNDGEEKTAFHIVQKLNVPLTTSLSYLPEQSRIHSGHLVGTIVNNMKLKVADQTTTPTKMFMYSAHDATLVSLMNALNISDGNVPPFAACLFIELHTTSIGSYAVRIVYLTDVSKEPVVLSIPQCSSWCPLEKFQKLVHNVAYYNDEQRSTECSLQ
ncbi:His Phos 2 domain containing protein [Trichuris trichiura]|uniref:acid phosphatase n=1 Tax=Trichuris trichiura TaxID=36087 RepID=A0A077YWP4_TRITR|nr:His Phos 2 domain containing protein [Trichuris trichiura]